MQNTQNEIEALRLTNIANIIPPSMLKNYLNNNGGVNFELPLCVFKPDQWTRAFLGGVNIFGSRGGFTGKKVVELGTGCGINLIVVKNLFNPEYIYGSDIHPDVYKNAQANILLNLEAEKRNGIEIIPGGHNLGSWMSNDFKADVIFGCLPQVIAPKKIAEEDFVGTNNESSSHYYIPEIYPLARESAHLWGLALNEHALQKLKQNLNAKGQIVLNLGGRPGKERLLDMFVSCGYEPEILHEEFIEQHIGTSIETLVEQEMTFEPNKTFEFFDQYKNQISAKTAQEIRVAGGRIFHKIYVILGTKK